MDDIGPKIRPLLVHFKETLGYTTARAVNNRDAIYEGMRREADAMGIPYPEGSQTWVSFETGVNYACFCFAGLSLGARIFAGILTWVAIIVDDSAKADAEQWYQFTPRFLAGAKQPNVIAQGWDRCIRQSYQHYSPIAANFIITSCLNFTNASALEGAEIPKMTRTAGGQSWPYYIRDKNGLAEAYAWMTFQKETCPDFSNFIQVIPDMAKYLCLANDVLSFYKEECSRETDNYMHDRASCEGISVYEVFRQVVEEVANVHHGISLALRGKTPYAEVWHDHALGYVSMHTTSSRYRLRDLGLDEVAPQSHPR
ncbi:putative longiborneol synthase [Rosellinia necatrix]|uniref:Putative longiborneol synthase n=1 Tax=Rosellinia necatrix TaxID=77044 RepID=A0A1W2TNB2_ROSNE|nr:putative longiborneol synthase [Rosellinia necatrix]